MSSQRTGAPPSSISSRMTCASFGSTPFIWGSFLTGVPLLLLAALPPPPLFGVVGRLRRGDSLPGTDSCRFTEGGVSEGLINEGRWQGSTTGERPMLRGSVWLLFITLPGIRLPDTGNLRPEAEIKETKAKLLDFPAAGR